MADVEKPKGTSEADVLATASSPLVFISHDARDADLAEAFAKLLKSVSAGMIKTFRSSDKKGTEGVDFGDEWYKRLMSMLQSTSDVVCLFTERSLDRPWILFEAGVAKGKLSTPVIGVAVGVALSRISAGPFYQFQNMDDSEADLTKLVHQIARRVQGLELDADVVKVQVATFKATEAEILKKLSTPESRKEGKGLAEENPIAKLVEEMKSLPTRVAERLAESEEPYRGRRGRRINPMMLEDMMHMMHMGGEPGDPVPILIAASLVRDDLPWLYELAMEVYRAVKSGDPTLIEIESTRLRRFSETMMHGPFMMGGFGGDDKDTHMLVREFPRMLQRVLDRTLESAKPRTRLRHARADVEKS
jgi:hypothetical protein